MRSRTNIDNEHFHTFACNGKPMTKQQKHQKFTSPNKLNTKLNPQSLFEKTEIWIENKSSFLFILLLGLSFLFSLLLFNARISEGGDDSTYIQAAYNYSKDFFNYYFSFQATLYPMFLSLPIAILGLNVVALKVFSIIFYLLNIFFFYKTFFKRIPHIVYFPVLTIISVNYHFLYFASQTYNEAFVFFLQSLFFYSFIKLQEIFKSDTNEKLSMSYKHWLFFGLAIFLLTMSKNITVTAVGSTLVYFLINKEFKHAFYAVVSYLTIKIPFEVFKYLVWGNQGQYSSQGSVLLLKDPYDTSKGNEDLTGFIDRFIQNSDIYLSRRFFQIIGFKSDDSYTISIFVTVIISAIFLLGFIRVLMSKNKLLLFTSLHTLCMMLIMFVVLQARWDQLRLIIIYVPVLLLMSLYGFYQVFRRSSFAQLIYFSVIITLILCSFSPTLKKSKENFPVLSRNSKGDMYYGYTPDWINFLKMSEWCGKNLPDSAYVCSRKASMSFIYSGGKKFYGIYKVIALDTVTKVANPDSVLAIFRKNKVTHFILASLRNNPEKADGNIINTIHRVMYPVMQKYPDKVRLVYQFPPPDQPQIEPSYLYQIVY